MYKLRSITEAISSNTCCQSLTLTVARMDDGNDFLCPKCKSPVLFALNKIPSPVPCIFHSNEPPTRLESQLIHDTLNEAKHQISTIDAEIARIEAALEKLRSQREALVNHRAAHSSLLSPLRRLPPELLSEVFVHLSRSSHSHSPFNQGSTPLILSQVCRRWRIVALSTPALWSSLDLNYHDDSRLDLELPIEAVSTWLSSSGQLVLSLSISFPENTPASSVHRLFDLIAAFSHRLGALDISAAQPIVRTLFSMLHSFPRLEQLLLSMYTDPQPDEETVEIVAPKLTTVSIISSFSLYRFHLPWSQVTKLRTYDTDMMTCLSIIASSPSLQSYSTLTYFDDPSLLATPIISNIRSLSLDSHDPECLLSNLTLPLLSEFKSTSDYMGEFGSWFVDLAERSQFHLRKLVVTCAREDCGCYRILWKLPFVSKLEELELCFGGATMQTLKDTLGRLMDGPSHSTITHPRLSPLPAFPRLRAITSCSLSEGAVSMLVEMVSPPWKAEVERREYSHLRSITLRRP